ncbi:hypothetical protein MTO96_047703 [Rhipicephalus appendiculatus]
MEHFIALSPTGPCIVCTTIKQLRSNNIHCTADHSTAHRLHSASRESHKQCVIVAPHTIGHYSMHSDVFTVMFETRDLESGAADGKQCTDGHNSAFCMYV